MQKIDYSCKNNKKTLKSMKAPKNNTQQTSNQRQRQQQQEQEHEQEQ